MMNKKLSFFSALLIFLFANILFAQQNLNETKISPEKQALIKEYLEVTGGREAVIKSIDAVYDNLDKVLPALLSANIEQDSGLNGEQKANLQKIMPEVMTRVNRRFREELNKELNFAKVVEDINYPLLDKFFTEAELKDLITFYKSPTGQKAISLQPQIYTEASTKLNVILLPAIQKVMKKVTAEETIEIIKKINQDK